MAFSGFSIVGFLFHISLEVRKEIEGRTLLTSRVPWPGLRYFRSFCFLVRTFVAVSIPFPRGLSAFNSLFPGPTWLLGNNIVLRLFLELVFADFPARKDGPLDVYPSSAAPRSGTFHSGAEYILPRVNRCKLGCLCPSHENQVSSRVGMPQRVISAVSPTRRPRFLPKNTSELFFVFLSRWLLIFSSVSFIQLLAAGIL